MSLATVFAGGDLPPGLRSEDFADAALIVAADSGVRHARALGCSVHAVVGDLDSASAGDLDWARSQGAEIHSFPADKDATDLALAMTHVDDAAMVEQMVIVGVEGGRIDHEMGNWAVCCGPWTAGVDVLTERGQINVLRGDGRSAIELPGAPGEVFSLLARNGAATGVNAEGVRWPLADATVPPDSSLGISNEFVDRVARVSVENGVLLVIRPAKIAGSPS